MSKENSKKIISNLHRQNILSSAEELFLEKGFTSTTITDISKLSEYSRRTIYSYFDSKQEILNHIVLIGLKELLKDIRLAMDSSEDFISKYKLICKAMENYYLKSACSFEMVNQMKNKSIDMKALSKTAIEIFTIGSEINRLLESYIDEGKEQGMIRSGVKTKETVYIMWSSISSLLSLVDNKGRFIEKDANTSKEAFLSYGYRQILNSILKERME